MALKIAGVGLVIGFLLIVGIFAYFRKDLPKIKDISGNNFGGSVTYYDRTGQTVLFQDYDERKRVPVDGKSISEYMKKATIAIEDKNFYQHGAFDTRGIMRAIVHDVTGKGGTQGGSTITQQLVKINEGWTNDRTISRKVKELILAVELEREYSKDEILIGYLNMAPYGNVNYGVETASKDYFGVSAKDLTLEQAALLAAIPKAPGALSPFSSPTYNPSLTTDYFDSESLIGRQHYILDQMVNQKYVTASQAAAAKKVDILAQVKQMKSHYADIQAPYFVLAARSELRRTFPSAVVNRGGWKVTTTIDLKVQDIAQQQLDKNKYLLNRYGADNAAFVAQDTDTGQVVALIGGVDFTNKEYGEINYATDVNISPGSSIKPYDYVTFIDNNTNVGAGSVLYDSQGPLPGYPCTNRQRPGPGSQGNCLFDFDRSYPGPMTLRYALGGSRNVPAVKAFLSAVPNDNSAGRVASINKVMGTVNGLMAGSAGYRCFKSGTDVSTATKANETQCYASAGIGDGAYLHLDEHVNGIASIARMGNAIPRTYILKVVNSSGKTLKQYVRPQGKQVVKQDAAYIVNDMASDPGASYLGGYCNDNSCSGAKFHRYKGWKIGIKTGTTNDQFDGLMMAWNKKYTAGIWVGNHTRTVAFNTQPENITGPIMKGFMQAALDTAGPANNWEQPSGIKTAPAYVNRTSTSRGQTIPSKSTDLFPSWYTGKSGANTTQVIDKVTNKIATSCTPPLAKQGAANSNASSWNVDVFMGGSTGAAAPTTGKDDIHNCNDTQPSISVTAINGTAGNSYRCPLTGCGTIAVMVHVEQGTHQLTSGDRPNFPGTINLIVNDQTVQSQAVGNTGDYQLSYTPPADASGTLSFSVQVIDSVLYDAKDSGTISIEPRPTQPSAPTPPSTGTTPNAGPN